MSARADNRPPGQRFGRTEPPWCGAPLPTEPGPMCAREPGHPGPHISASGLFQWVDDAGREPRGPDGD